MRDNKFTPKINPRLRGNSETSTRMYKTREGNYLWYRILNSRIGIYAKGGNNEYPNLSFKICICAYYTRIKEDIIEMIIPVPFLKEIYVFRKK